MACVIRPCFCLQSRDSTLHSCASMFTQAPPSAAPLRPLPLLPQPAWCWLQDQLLQRSFTQESLSAVAASPNGAYLAAGGNSGTIYVWDTASGALLRSWPAHYKVRVLPCLCIVKGFSSTYATSAIKRLFSSHVASLLRGVSTLQLPCFQGSAH